MTRTVLSVRAEVRICRDWRALGGRWSGLGPAPPSRKGTYRCSDSTTCPPERCSAAHRLTVEIGDHVFVVVAPYAVGIFPRLMQSERAAVSET